MQTMTQTVPVIEQTPEAIAKVFWLAFNALSKSEQKAVLTRLQVTTDDVELSPQPASSLSELVGWVAWGGDALLDSERYYDDL
jgi:hypothetical protein